MNQGLFPPAEIPHIYLDKYGKSDTKYDRAAVKCRSLGFLLFYIFDFFLDRLTGRLVYDRLFLTKEKKMNALLFVFALVHAEKYMKYIFNTCGAVIVNS